MSDRIFFEVDHTGHVFHMTGFAGQQPPDEVWYCDCAGAGRHTHSTDNHRRVPNEQYKAPPVKGEDTRAVGERTSTRSETHGEWMTRHSGTYCAPRRQYFVEVTDRLGRELDWRDGGAHRKAFDSYALLHDERSDTFSIEKV